MGAWVVQKNHIQYLVAVAVGMGLQYKFRGEYKMIDNPNRLANALFDANKTSVLVLNDDQQGWFVEPEGEDSIKYNFASTDIIDPITEDNYAQIYKSAICYECQANGFNDWEDSEAKAFIDAIKAVAVLPILAGIDNVDKEIPDYEDFYVTMTPEYDKANWGAGQLIRRQIDA